MKSFFCLCDILTYTKITLPFLGTRVLCDKFKFDNNEKHVKPCHIAFLGHV